MITQEQKWAAYLLAQELGIFDGSQCGYESSLVEKLLVAADAAAWMPIGTSPKDGSVIEIWPIHEDYPQVNRVFWHQNQKEPSASRWNDLGDKYNAPGTHLGYSVIAHWRYPADAPTPQSETYTTDGERVKSTGSKLWKID